MADFHGLNQQEHGILQHWLARIEAHMSDANVRMAGIETRMDNLETRMSGVEEQSTEINRTLKQHIAKLDSRYGTLHCSTAYANRAIGMHRTRSISNSKEHHPNMPIVSL